MKLSHYGLWEKIRKELVWALLIDSNIYSRVTKEQIDEALLEPIITEFVAENMRAHAEMHEQELAPEKKSKIAYDRALETILPSLSKALDIEEELLKASVDSFVVQYKRIIDEELPDFYKNYMPFRTKTITNVVMRAYGKDFSEKYPKLAPKLYHNDPSLIQLVASRLSVKISRDLKANDPVKAERWAAHMEYMAESASQLMANPDFLVDFEKETGKTIEQFKLDVASKEKGYQLTSWGKWENIRKELQQSLLSDASLKLNEQSLEQLLLTEVVTNLINAASIYTLNNIQKWKESPKELLIESSQESMDAILDTLDQKLGLTPQQIGTHLFPFFAKAEEITLLLIDHTIFVGSINYQTKNKLFTQHYGEDFKNKYPDLVERIILNDPQIINEAKQEVFSAIEQRVAKSEVEVADLLKQNLIYLNEIAMQKNDNVSGFEKKFNEVTGKSMHDYKKDRLPAEEIENTDHACSM
ncbi:MAG: hypothetical protein WC785_08100 [Tatlockia sp.]|jgi:hypothetical protein